MTRCQKHFRHYEILTDSFVFPVADEFRLGIFLFCLLAFLAACDRDDPIRPDVIADAANWEIVLTDPGTGDWQEHWFVEGKKATVEYDEESLVFTSGPVPMEQASHAVLWTRQTFAGDIRIEYDYTRVDSMADVPSVNILYLQATGLGTDESPTDIFLSTGQREVPWMKSYFLNMNALHVSYATTGPKRANYVAARRYPAKDEESFMNGTMIQPIYEDVHLFEPGETYHIMAVCRLMVRTISAIRTRASRFTWFRRGRGMFPAGRC